MYEIYVLQNIYEKTLDYFYDQLRNNSIENKTFGDDYYIEFKGGRHGLEIEIDIFLYKKIIKITVATNFYGECKLRTYKTTYRFDWEYRCAEWIAALIPNLILETEETIIQQYT